MHTVPVPLHLETEDHFLFGLTVRQCLILFGGAGVSYVLFLRMLALLPASFGALMVSLVLALGCFAGTAALAFVHQGGRGLEEWGLVLLIYMSQPKVYTWHFNTPDVFEYLDEHSTPSPSIRGGFEEDEMESEW